ncbi:hypothetical protein GCM10009836_70920 [Pseudonocardia ailaonensis]|uniref:Dentin sialophosphoprotein n=1 Tax=Pseudonocardia ailaonensis TaxID=367279 RepID=A0ABN2NPS8_9PSEU
MSSPSALIQVLLDLLSDPATAAEFQANPADFLAKCGITDVSAEQIHDAIALIDDDSAPHKGGHDAPHHGGHTTPPPPPADHSHEAAVKYLNTYVSNYYVDDRDTTIDNSINQNIHTGGGDVNQNFDNHSVVASGDGSVAAAGNISGPVTTGNGNVVGDNNHISGNGSTTSFGDGAATSTNVGGNVSVGDGGAFATGGTARVDNSDSSVHHSGNVSTDSSVHDSLNNSSDHSITTATHDESDHSTHVDADSHADSSTHTTVHSDVDNSIDHSGNFIVH